MIKVNEQNDVPLSHHLNSYKYARVTYEGKPLSLEIDAVGFEFDDSEWDISPHSYEIKGKKKEHKLSFTIDRIGYLVVRFSKDQDFTKRLVIFIEAPGVVPRLPRSPGFQGDQGDPIFCIAHSELRSPLTGYG